jgi:hypothetical protein
MTDLDQILKKLAEQFLSQIDAINETLREAKND